MIHHSSHLTVLEASASLHPHAPAFKIPQYDLETNHIYCWQSITYAQFLDDVERSARFWGRVLNANGISKKSTVGLWLRGMTYTDVLHIYGVSRAGYVPQLFSLGLPNPAVVFELLQLADAQALVFDPSFESAVTGCHIPTHLAVNYESMHDDGILPSLPKVLSGDETAFVFHTSGSTSGRPKLVPCSYRWLNSTINKARHVCAPRNPSRQDVTVWMGSMCHIAQTFMLLGNLQHGSCTIQPTKIAFSTDELVEMVERCGLNRLNQFSTFLSTHLTTSRRDARILALLSNLDEVIHSGLPLPREDEDWAYRNKINLKNLFGNTECGAMLVSIGGNDCDAPLLRPVQGVSYGFFPVASTNTGNQSNVPLLELVILSQSEDCPHPSLRQADGHFHTGDLFQEVVPGSYVSRGRDDDWIKSQNSLRCDTKSIEDNVRATCGNLVEECVVVGTGRPSPTIFVEPAENVPVQNLREEIISRTRQFHSRRYLHERITSPNMIVIVPRNSLPRTTTKGNIRRKAVEEAYKEQLDQIYCNLQ